MRIDHIGIATNAIDGSVDFWRETLGLQAGEIEEVSQQKVRVCMLPVGESQVELLEATSADSPISKFLEKRGQGIHHIAFRVDDIRGMLAELKTKGVRLIDEDPRRGAGGCLVAFIHPSSTGGVLLELVQRPDDAGQGAH